MTLKILLMKDVVLILRDSVALKIIDDYFLGKNSMPADPITWFNEISNHNLDNYSNQNWTLNKILNE